MELWQKAGDLLKKIPKDYYLPIGIGCTGLILFAYGFFNIFTKFLSSENYHQPAGGSSFSQSTANPNSSGQQTSAVLGTSSGIKVDIEGAVQSAGVYSLPTDARVQDALVVAGGISQAADRDWLNKNVNLALKLTDGTKIYIPTSEEVQNLKNTSEGSQVSNSTWQNNNSIANNGSLNTPGVTLGSSIDNATRQPEAGGPLSQKTRRRKKGSAAATDQSAVTTSSDTPLNIGLQTSNNQQININTASFSDLRTLPGVGPVTANKIINNRPYSSIQDLLLKRAVGKKEFGKIKDRITIAN